MDNVEIYKYLKDYNARNNFCTTDDGIFETLQEAEQVYSEDCGNNRWWKNIFKVVKIEDLLIGYMDAETTGDDSPRDVGWDFDPTTLCEVEEKEVAVKKYVPKS